MAMVTSGTRGPAPPHPLGLRYLFLTEDWERFSYYGMTALVMLYMVHHVLLPAYSGSVTALGGARVVLEVLFGPLTPRQLASQIFGLYTAFVYLTPVLGGLLADRVLGVRRTVLLGGALLAAGHFAMAFDAGFLLALVLLVCGTGCLKGNISAQVGSLYPIADEERRTRGYVVFYTGINVGATLGPIVSGALAQSYGWHAGFALSGALMLLSMATYLAGFRHFPPDAPRHRQRASVPLTGAQRTALLALAPIIAITVFQTVSYYQCFAVGQIWISERVDLATPFGRIPPAWFNAVDALVSVLSVPPLLWFWRRQARRGREPDAVGKIRIGAALATICSLLLWAGNVLAGPSALVDPLVPLLAIAGFGLALNFYWPPALALVSRAAPAAFRSTAMGLAYLSYFTANLLKGWLGTFYEPLGPSGFWLMNAGVASIGLVLLLLFGDRLGARLDGAITVSERERVVPA